MEMMVQWATILSPIIAVIIAIWATKSNAKDTDKKIAVFVENTEKELQRLKELSRLQVEGVSTVMEMEMTKNRLISQQALDESREISRIMSDNQLTFRNMRLNDFNSRKPERDNKYLNAYVQELNQLSRKLSQIKEQLN